ncbi:uncharacterized protein LOC129770623 [Toxorhynchites rutilus septentrionalis]|uniref:uncharacterized protein LOC129770623 n=1 Tax=Toxorhynchites rutilus septentrionalis TaxID=329112 RepID=UPI0024796400|nr:uncharacterized protein LOC129770623 [Toxorhynchites rutilus septentrionalis]
MTFYSRCFISIAMVAVAVACNVPIKHYKTMNCTPIGENKFGCPTRYDCPSVTQHDNSKCYFNGNTYALSEQIPSEKVNPFCSALCYCRSGTPFAQFRCAHVDCAEFFQRFDYDNCVRTYKPNSCCSAGQLCGEAKLKASKCSLDGEQYLEGQRMHPAGNKCLTCICHSKFNEVNMKTDPNCYETTCGFELFYAKQAYNGGAPVYYGDNCCPWEWRMPNDSDKLVEGTPGKVTSDPNLQCKYGKLTMNIGDSLAPEIVDKYTYKCSCLIPPMAQCVKTMNEKE